MGLRQWVLTFPFAWRRRLAHDGTLLGLRTRIFVVDTVHAYFARATGETPGKTGAVTIVQRTSSDMRLNPHLYVVFLDGTYREDGTALTWAALSAR